MREGGGQMQQGAAAATTVYENGGASVPSGDAGDAVMTRWLQSAGLQHLASPLAPNPVDHHLLPNILIQGYGPQSADEKQRLSKLMRNLTFNGEIVSTPYIPSSSAIAPSNDFQSPEFKGDFGAGLLDLHSMDDTELLPDHIISEPIEASSSMPAVTETCEGDFDGIASWGQTGQADAEAPAESSANGKENSTKENNVAKIKVVVRKRPLNKKEMSRKEDDIVTVSDDANLTLHEPKLKVDLTAYVEKHEFCFDAVLDEQVTNDEVYRNTVEPIIPIIFQRTKATCFAYGQTGSGKTYTMKPLPIRAAEDLVRTLHQPVYHHQRFKLWLSYFEIYGGKLYDLLNDRKKLCMREDGKQQVCIVGLQEFEVSNVQIVKEYIERGNAARSTGSTGANEESSRSHAILQLVVKKHKEVKESKRNNDGNEPRRGKVVGKISFIDLAGSERGADTTDNDRQTRIEGAQINKSLLALKECIRALDNDQIHIPFRGSKLTEVLRDSFVGNSRTVMISCISPSAGSCEHTLNTLRYADRVKSLSKSGNPKKDQGNVKEPSTPTLSNPAETRDDNERGQESVAVDKSRRARDDNERSQESIAVDKSRRATDDERQPSSFSSNFNLNGREESGMNAVRTAFKESISQKNNSIGNSQSSASTEEKVQKASPPQPPQQKGQGDERLEIIGMPRKDRDGLDLSSNSYKQENMNNIATSSDSKQYKPEPPPPDENTHAIIEEEKALIAAHRKEIEDTMEIVREEMKLLAEVDQPGSHIDSYMTQLSFVLSRKAATLVGLQARLARFQHRLKEQEILSRRRVPR